MPKFYTKRIGNAATYKITPPEDVSRNSAYFTIVGDDKPIAFFFNSKAMESFQWITALMTSWSDMIEAGVPVSQIIDSMKETFDPGGDYYIQGGSFSGTHVNSVVHHLGLILEDHVKKNCSSNNVQ